MNIQKAITKAATEILMPRAAAVARKATVYIAPDSVVKITRQRKPEKRGRGETFVLTIGKPNHAERAFIAKCKKAGEPFPVRKAQLKFFP